jgi:hypothetical protein
MANVNVTLRRLNNGTWDQMFPKTTVDQIVDLSSVGTNLLDKENPTANSFIRINQNGTITYLSATQLKSAEEGMDAADRIHYHAIADITNSEALGGDGVNLQTKLDNKANLTSPNGTIVSDEIPDFLFSGMRFIRTANGSDDMTILLAAINGTLDKEKKGGYFVATADFTLVSGSNSSLLVAYGDDGGTEIGASVQVEKGDWIVYAGSNEFAIVNNTYRVAGHNSKGIVALSAGTNTVRSQLQNTSDGLKVMDEKAVKTVMKDIFYQSSQPGAGQTGDLWFEGTFA